MWMCLLFSGFRKSSMQLSRGNSTISVKVFVPVFLPYYIFLSDTFHAIADISRNRNNWPWCAFFKLVYFVAQRTRNFGLLWPVLADFGCFVANLRISYRLHWCGGLPKFTQSNQPNCCNLDPSHVQWISEALLFSWPISTFTLSRRVFSLPYQVDGLLFGILSCAAKSTSLPKIGVCVYVCVWFKPFMLISGVLLMSTFQF